MYSSAFSRGLLRSDPPAATGWTGTWWGGGGKRSRRGHQNLQRLAKRGRSQTHLAGLVEAQLPAGTFQLSLLLLLQLPVGRERKAVSSAHGTLAIRPSASHRDTPTTITSGSSEIPAGKGGVEVPNTRTPRGLDEQRDGVQSQSDEVQSSRSSQRLGRGRAAARGLSNLTWWSPALGSKPGGSLGCSAPVRVAVPCPGRRGEKANPDSELYCDAKGARQERDWSGWYSGHREYDKATGGAHGRARAHECSSFIPLIVGKNIHFYVIAKIRVRPKLTPYPALTYRQTDTRPVSCWGSSIVSYDHCAWSQVG